MLQHSNLNEAIKQRERPKTCNSCHRTLNNVDSAMLSASPSGKLVNNPTSATTANKD